MGIRFAEKKIESLTGSFWGAIQGSRSSVKHGGFHKNQPHTEEILDSLVIQYHPDYL